MTNPDETRLRRHALANITFTDEEMTLLSSVELKLAELRRANIELPTHLIVHPTRLPRSAKIWGLHVLHHPWMEVNAAALVLLTSRDPLHHRTHRPKGRHPMTQPANPTLEDLATACDNAHQAYLQAQTTAAASLAQANSDAASATTAHAVLDTAIQNLVAAAQAEDPPATTSAAKK
jgi:hypothetical protein